jgi:hypothetical protein
MVSGALGTIGVMPEPFFTLVAMFVGCVGGAYASFSWGEPVEPRGRLVRLFISCIIMGLSLTAITNSMIEVWLHVSLTTGVKVAMSSLISCLTRFIMPKFIASIQDGSWKTIIPFIKRDK